MPLLLRLRDMSLNAIFFLSGNTVAEDISKTEALEFLVAKVLMISMPKAAEVGTPLHGAAFFRETKIVPALIAAMRMSMPKTIKTEHRCIME